MTTTSTEAGPRRNAATTSSTCPSRSRMTLAKHRPRRSRSRGADGRHGPEGGVGGAQRGAAMGDPQGWQEEAARDHEKHNVKEGDRYRRSSRRHQLMEAGERGAIVSQLSAAFGGAQDVTPAQDQPLPRPAPAAGTAGPWTHRRPVGSRCGVTGPASDRSSRSTSELSARVANLREHNPSICWAKLRGFSFSFPWTGDDPLARDPDVDESIHRRALLDGRVALMARGMAARKVQPEQGTPAAVRTSNRSPHRA